MPTQSSQCRRESCEEKKRGGTFSNCYVVENGDLEKQTQVLWTTRFWQNLECQYSGWSYPVISCDLFKHDKSSWKTSEATSLSHLNCKSKVTCQLVQQHMCSQDTDESLNPWMSVAPRVLTKHCSVLGGIVESSSLLSLLWSCPLLASTWQLVNIIQVSPRGQRVTCSFFLCCTLVRLWMLLFCYLAHLSQVFCFS